MYENLIGKIDTRRTGKDQLWWGTNYFAPLETIH